MKAQVAEIIPTTGPPAKAPRHTVFFGLLPPEAVARSAHQLARSLLQSSRVCGDLRPAHVLHVTLMPVATNLAEPPPSWLIERLQTRAEAVKQRPFTVFLNRLQAWTSGAVVAVGDDGVFGVEALHRSLAETFGKAESPSFNPHMTLLYGGGPATPLPIPPITWPVREFALIHSFAGLTRYKVLARFPLSAHPEA